MGLREGGGIRVALVEERALLRDCLARVLTESGIEVAAQYSDPRQFIAELAADAPPVAVVGIRASGSDGVWLLQEVRHGYSHVRLVVLCDTEEAVTLEECFQNGAAACLPIRSVRADAVVDAVRAAARGESVLPGALIDSLLRPAAAETPETLRIRALSAREREVLAYVSAGIDNEKIAGQLNVSERTVKAHVSNLYRKLEQDNRTQLALLARKMGIRPPRTA
ncbi:MAG TPA: response regulator transcription factor [Myxococcaceae bacterium]|nr:response regulator transcription factor [Myxococcaceae bacterium]